MFISLGSVFPFLAALKHSQRDSLAKTLSLTLPLQVATPTLFVSILLRLMTDTSVLVRGGTPVCPRIQVYGEVTVVNT